jgi:hypothetical protein
VKASRRVRYRRLCKEGRDAVKGMALAPQIPIFAKNPSFQLPLHT